METNDLGQHIEDVLFSKNSGHLAFEIVYSEWQLLLKVLQKVAVYKCFQYLMC